MKSEWEPRSGAKEGAEADGQDKLGSESSVQQPWLALGQSYGIEERLASRKVCILACGSVRYRM